MVCWVSTTPPKWTLEEASPRIVRAMRPSDAGRRGFAFTAAGHAARLNGELTPELYAALRAEGPGGVAEHPIRDTLGSYRFGSCRRGSSGGGCL